MESICKIDRCGNKYWKNSHNEYHREDGPAIENIDGSKFWMINGQLHREDGPAVIWSSGKPEYWLNDKKLSEETYYKLPFSPTTIKNILEPITRKRLIELD